MAIASTARSELFDKSDFKTDQAGCSVGRVCIITEQGCLDERAIKIVDNLHE